MSALTLVGNEHRRLRKERAQTPPAPKKHQDSNERDHGVFKGEEESGVERDGKGVTKSRNPLAPTPKTTS